MRVVITSVVFFVVVVVVAAVLLFSALNEATAAAAVPNHRCHHLVGFLHHRNKIADRKQGACFHWLKRFASSADGRLPHATTTIDTTTSNNKDSIVAVNGIPSTTTLVDNPGAISTASAVVGGWWRRLMELQEYHREHGHCRVPKRFAENPSLGNFVNKQRQLYRQFQQGLPCSLTQERIDILNTLGFCWNGQTNHNNNDNLPPSKKQRHSPRLHSCASNSLGAMLEHSPLLTSNTTGYNLTNNSGASDIHVNRQGIDTKSCSQYEATWWKRYNDLKSYMTSNNITNLAMITSSSTWGIWLNAQRNEYWKGRLAQPQESDKKSLSKATTTSDDHHSASASASIASRLTLDMIMALEEELHMDWHYRRQQIWELRLRELRDYQQEHGDTCVPITYAANPALAQWISRQRKNYNAKRRGHVNSLTQERMEQLDAMGFVWNRWDYEFTKKTQQIIAKRR